MKSVSPSRLRIVYFCRNVHSRNPLGGLSNLLMTRDFDSETFSRQDETEETTDDQTIKSDSKTL